MLFQGKCASLKHLNVTLYEHTSNLPIPSTSTSYDKGPLFLGCLSTEKHTTKLLITIPIIKISNELGIPWAHTPFSKTCEHCVPTKSTHMAHRISYILRITHFALLIFYSAAYCMGIIIIIFFFFLIGKKNYIKKTTVCMKSKK